MYSTYVHNNKFWMNKIMRRNKCVYPSRYFYIFSIFYKPSAPIEAWKCNFPLFWEIMTDHQTDRPTNPLTDRQGHMLHFQ